MPEPELAQTDPQTATCFADRFELHELLGSGGMAEVHRATDLSNGRSVALKQLIRPDREQTARHTALLFEREFYTLSQLSHPCVIEVYDYGVTPQGTCYYTMELLDGGALRDRSPLHWRTACQLMFDVCSSLALLHSRRLLHRDVSPRNVHCTQDGRAKLIDFGAVAAMATDGGLLVGTPAFTSPEAVHRSALDARSDLYSFGATLYYALTKRFAYPAHTFADLDASWNEQPAPPSTYAADVPPALDDLVMALLATAAALRPPSAFVVMQRIAAIANLQTREADGVSRAYLATPALTGRQDTLTHVREHMRRALHTGGPGLMLRAASGMGRSRLLDTCAVEAKALGAIVLRANARGTRHDFEVASALTQHLLDAMPSEQLFEQFPELIVRTPPDTQADSKLRAPFSLRELSELRKAPEVVERSVLTLMHRASLTRPLMLAVDDIQRLDAPSAAVIAALIDRFQDGRAVVVLTHDSDQRDDTLALDALSRRCETLSLEPLTQAETKSLFGSMFGDVPNLEHVSQEIYAIARGNPRACLDLAQDLVHRGIITYDAGTWTLPRSLSHEDLPQSAEAAIRARIEQLQPLARFVGQAHALSFVERLTYDDYRTLAAGAGPRALDSAVRELLAEQVLQGDADGEGYVIANRLWSTTLVQLLDPSATAQAHQALAALFADRVQFAWIHHVLASETGELERALDALLTYQSEGQPHSSTEHIDPDVGKLLPSYPRALEIARRLKRPPRQLYDLRRGMLQSVLAAGKPEYYALVAPCLLEQLVRDSGLDLWRQDSDNTDASGRLTQALARASERYQALPEPERVYTFAEAIERLAEYVVISIAVGGRTHDVPLLRSLPALVEPFAPLAPLVAAIWQNAVSTTECYDCHYERARAGWLEVLTSLKDVTGAKIRHVTAIRNAIAYVLGMIEAVFGLPSAARWADLLDTDPFQRVSALYLHKIVCLEQGDWVGADKLQRGAELLALRTRVPQMFTSTLTVELTTHALALDLAGVQEVIQRGRAEAARYPGWLPYVHDAQARFELIRGDFARARDGFERVIEQTAPDANLRSDALPVWVDAQSGLCEALLGLDQPEQARARAQAAVNLCQQLDIHMFANDVVRMLALAEARLGHCASAIARLERLIANQTAFGATGLRMGVTYEARAEVALWDGNAADFDTYARLTAVEYRRGAGCPLSVRYERLTREARKRGIGTSLTLDDAKPMQVQGNNIVTLSKLRSTVRRALSGTRAPCERYLRALSFLCTTYVARGGHLYVPEPPGSQLPGLMVSYNLSPPSAALRQRIREFLAAQDEGFETRALGVGERYPEKDATPLAHADDLEYELWPLAGADRADVIAVIALARNDPASPLRPARQLLTAIADQLQQIPTST